MPPSASAIPAAAPRRARLRILTVSLGHHRGICRTYKPATVESDIANGNLLHNILHEEKIVTLGHDESLDERRELGIHAKGEPELVGHRVGADWDSVSLSHLPSAPLPRRPVQMVGVVKALDESSYHVGTAAGSEEEIGRLDEMSVAFTRYLEGKLSPANLNELRPRKILDLGCGSGAWAIQAAMQFPDAEVLAVDVVPLPERALPPNVRFERVDLEKELMNLGPATFDIVHSRLVLIHLSNADAVVKRAAQLVRPGGMLILADMDFGSSFETGGQAARRLLSDSMTVWNARGADLEFGRKISDSMSSSGLFPAGVNVHRVLVPLSGTGADDATNELGIALRKSWLKVADSLERMLKGDGYTELMAKEQEDELNQKDCKTVWDMYFCWGQRGSA
ncbi:hypothetical protein C8R45DRAFT_1213145 [Mycena sanguinolenta]|nr:hypothetical protein C8R45DRAFT_1213145 [Mycena sanguinolenta]